MSAIGTEERTIGWAVKLFRPLLQDLKIQKLEDSALVFTANYKAFQKLHIDSCIIIVKRHKFSKENYKGVFIWQYNKKNDIFALYMILNENMYTGKEINEIHRKAVSTHEFTHCVAALLTLSRLKTPLLVENQQKKLADQFHAIEESDIKNLMADISTEMLKPDADQLLSFPDSHFRTGDEDFEPKYSDLYRNFLLSTDLFEEYFTSEVKARLAQLINDGNDAEFGNLIAQKLTEISAKKRLELNFVLQRFRTEYIYELAKYIK